MTERPTLDPVVLSDLTTALSEDRVVIDGASVDEFKDPYWIPGDDTYVGSAVVFPTSVEEVQEVMRIANRHGVPVWPHGQGRGGYGGPSPVVRGSIQISLRKMNRVLEINEELAYAVVEPGVRWMDLYDAIEAGGHALQLSITDLGWGSVIGNSMDNGVTYQPYGSDFQLLCGLEVVLPTGELVRTGMGAIPDNKAWHLYRRGLGPSFGEMFAQSNYGIVVRAGVWLQPKPEAYAPLLLTVPNEEDLEVLIDSLRQLLLERTVTGVPAIMSTFTTLTTIFEAPAPPPELIDDEGVRALAEQYGIGAWSVRTALWGRRAVVDANLARIREVWEAIPGAKVISHRIFAPEEYGEIDRETDKVQAGIPTMKLIESGQWPANLGHAAFAPIVPLSGSEVRYVMEQLKQRFRENGLNFIGGLFALNQRTACVVAGLTFDLNEKEGAEKAYALAKQLVREVGELGYGEFRAHVDFMDDAQSIYNWNDGAYRRLAETIKDAVDPNGILSPGRHGIWPAKHREE
ncbi:FAD-binding oxidoreductase [Salinibacterium sp. GXW1014]|uniref:FAD-binding oxidoreductase n=1 Tax=Salinibacterium sp. GXW1014 TaxID=3377838 RepID=UPI00383AA635